MSTTTKDGFVLALVEDFKYAEIHMVEGTKTCIVSAVKNYIPIGDFKKLFAKIGELTKAGKVNKLVFDKRNLTVFHQPSMEWYFIEWKEEMFTHGLKTHRKILPNDRVFQESVKIGREKIFHENPEIKARDMDIQYADSLKEAIEK
ncbi:MAG: hypothetical protein LAT68_09570 [Cyclobacteriaceae bacterium]|nr:hypothetical protein [Cyclobacteriaceae bacterium]MCH8516563.1 hypothetical protein [Cyclobacteriaceae bacterium]